MSRSTHCVSSGGCLNSIQGRNPGTCCTCCVTKDHWEPSTCSRTQITCASGQPNTPWYSQAQLLWCHKRVDWRVEWLCCLQWWEYVLSVCQWCTYTCMVLFVEYNNCPGQQDHQISHQLNMYGTWWSGNLLFLQSLSQQLPNCDNGCKMLDSLSEDDIWHLYDHLHARIHACIATRGGTLCTDVIVWPPLTWYVCLVWSEFIINSYNDKLPVTSICNSMDLSFSVLHFFHQCIYIPYILISSSCRKEFSLATNMNLVYRSKVYY